MAQWRLICYRNFGTTYWYHLEGQIFFFRITLLEDCPYTPYRNLGNQSTLHLSPQERRTLSF